MQVVSDYNEIEPFNIVALAQQDLPVVLNSPHSGRCYRSSFLAESRLDSTRIRQSEDTFVDELVEGCVAAGMPLLRAQFPRVYLDVNREPYELDPKMFRDRLPSYANIRSVRVAGGLGTIPRVVAASEEVHSQPIALSEALGRIDDLYKPYHVTLQRLLAKTHVRFGGALLLDCHSMPSNIRGFEGPVQPDIIVGDRFGRSCSPTLVSALESALTDVGLTVARNKPYAGGFITEHYGQPERGLHAMQVEVNRALYMDELRFEKNSGFGPLARALETVIVLVGQVALHELTVEAVRPAAE